MVWQKIMNHKFPVSFGSIVEFFPVAYIKTGIMGKDGITVVNFIGRIEG
jgi:hypothetical protein